MKKKTKAKTDWRIIIAAIVALAAIECAAMAYGINGTLRTAIVGLICGLAGYVIPQPTTK